MQFQKQNITLSMIGFLLIFLTIGAYPSYYNQKDPDIRQPNILWIVADDLGSDLACYGTPLVQTPHLDKLASEGILYTNCFTVAAVCSPSRSALVTGMYPTSIESHNHRTHYKHSLSEPIKVITEYFRNAGYFTCNGSSTGSDVKGKQDYNFIAEQIYDGTDWSQRKTGQSFFAQIQIFDPHRPFHKDPARPIDPALIKLPPYYPDLPLVRQDWAFYLENVQIVDQMVGKILKRLDDEGLSENTIVFFFGDQGRPHLRAKQFLYDGGIHTPLIIRWPGQIKKGIIVDDLISNIDIASTSLSLADLDIPEHIQGNIFLGPKSTKREYIIAMRDRCDETVDRIRCVRIKRFKYIRNFYPDIPYMQYNAYKKYRYPVYTLMRVLDNKNELPPIPAQFMSLRRSPEELYDLDQDPHEINNVTDNQKHKVILEELRSTLDQWLADCDKGVYPEDPGEQRYWQEVMNDIYVKEMQKKGLSPDICDEDYLSYWEKLLLQK
jgi:uncharacterized sulfatase